MMLRENVHSYEETFWKDLAAIIGRDKTDLLRDKYSPREVFLLDDAAGESLVGADAWARMKAMRRLMAARDTDDPALSNAAAIHAYMRDHAFDGSEGVWVIVVDSRNRPKARIRVAWGGEGHAHVDYPTLFRAVILHGQRFILVHNHPSGDPTPSPQDVRMTESILHGCRHLQIQMLDHVVIAGDKYKSIRAMNPHLGAWA